MPRDELSNVYTFMPKIDPESEAAEPDPAPAAEGADDAEGDRLHEMAAILSCLEYLYGEAVRIQARMSAHLIGAAAESMRREIAEAKRGR
jgi:hypothetical protein